MAGLHGTRQRFVDWLGLSLVLVAACAVGASGQDERVVPPGAIESPPQAAQPQLVDSPASTYARYNEPPAPPFDFWQPTWMPCQSLRTNRSLVLGHLYWGMDILGWSTKGVHAPPLVTTS